MVNPAIILALAYIAFSLFPSIDTISDTIYWIQNAVLPFTILVSFSTSKFTHKDLLWIVKSLSISSTIFVFFVLLQDSPRHWTFSLHYILTLDRNNGFYYLGETTQGPTAVSSIIVVAIICNLTLIAYNKRHLIGHSVLIVILTVLLIVAGGRTSVVAAMLILMVIFILYNYHQPIPSKVFAVALTVMLGLTGILIFGIVSQYQSQSWATRFQAFTNLNYDSSFGTRIELFKVAAAMVAEDPLGYGTSYFIEQNELSTHNELLGQAVSFGVPAAFIYLLILLLSGWRLAKQSLHSNIIPLFVQVFLISVFITGLLVGLMENFSVSGSNSFNPIFWICLGLIHNNSIKLKPAEALTTPRTRFQQVIVKAQNK